MSGPKFGLYPSLKGRIVLVTGGASGIGAAIVRGFAAQGAQVGILDYDADAAARLVADLDGQCDWELCDLRDIGALQGAVTALTDRLGLATVLVNNAARDDRHSWQEVTPEYWDERMANNLRHMFFAIQATAPGMAEAGGGSVINLGSTSWIEGMGGMPAYTTAKAGVHGLTRGMARDLGAQRIRVNTVLPGWIMTERQLDLWASPAALKARKEQQCLPDLIDPDYVVRMILFLASDDAAMCTSGFYMVDGGGS